MIKYRSKRSFDPDNLLDRIINEMTVKQIENCTCQRNAGKNISSSDCVDCLAYIYNEVSKYNYDNMCPMVEKAIIEKENAPWYNQKIHNERRRRKAAEKKWRNKKLRTLEKYI